MPGCCCLARRCSRRGSRWGRRAVGLCSMPAARSARAPVGQQSHTHTPFVHACTSSHGTAPGPLGGQGAFRRSDAKCERAQVKAPKLDCVHTLRMNACRSMG